MTNDWTLNGDYLEPCNCDVAWRCSWMEAPDDGVCTVSLTWHIQEGSHGDVDLSGLHATWPANCADGNPFGPGVTWPFVVTLDETADAEQRAALEIVFAGRAGGIFGVAVDTHAERVEVSSPSSPTSSPCSPGSRSSIAGSRCPGAGWRRRCGWPTPASRRRWRSRTVPRAPAYTSSCEG